MSSENPYRPTAERLGPETQSDPDEMSFAQKGIGFLSLGFFMLAFVWAVVSYAMRFFHYFIFGQ